MEIFCRRVIAALAVLCICVLASNVDAAIVARVLPHRPATTIEGRGLALVDAPQTVLTYHNGPLLTAVQPIPVYIIWYGGFSKAQRATIEAFFASFGANAPATVPSIRSWWSLTAGYKDTKGKPVAASLSVAGEVSFAAQQPKKVLANADIRALVVRALQKLPANSNAIYVVLTAADVQLEEFCLNSCASHFASNQTLTKNKSLPYIWAGNPGTQCPGLCAWPFAKPQYGPPDFVPLSPPNGDVGIDGLLINLASVLAGTVTNPFDTGYYQGDASAPLEAATACAGTYGVGAYPGYPGQLRTDPATKASFNTYGVNKREFLMPALWKPSTSLCTPP